MITPIKSLEVYNRSMAQSVRDKLFFVDKVDACVYVDYGCADGTLLACLYAINADCDLNGEKRRYIGYDKSEEMIRLAKSRWSGSDYVIFTSDWNEVMSAVHDIVKDDPSERPSCIIFSSVLHEIFSDKTINQGAFWYHVQELGFNYIAVRDMATSNLVENGRDIPGVGYYLRAKYEEMAKDFEKEYGDLCIRKNAIHFLLKYRWTANWQRELAENYLALNPAIMISQLSTSGYSLIFHDAFTLPYLENVVKKETEISLSRLGPTHIKSIFKRN